MKNEKKRLFFPLPEIWGAIAVRVVLLAGITAGIVTVFSGENDFEAKWWMVATFVSLYFLVTLFASIRITTALVVVYDKKQFIVRNLYGMVTQTLPLEDLKVSLVSFKARKFIFPAKNRLFVLSFGDFKDKESGGRGKFIEYYKSDKIVLRRNYRSYKFLRDILSAEMFCVHSSNMNAAADAEILAQYEARLSTEK